MTSSLGRMGAAALSSASSALGSLSGGATKYGAYGLAMRFKVTIGGGLKDLGNWSVCQGLNVNFVPETVREGGQYEHPVYLPGEINYGQITLERAMQKDSSLKVRNWLRQVMTDWVNGESSGAPYEGEAITITLFDGRNGDEVATWELLNAVPTSWTGPSLSGRSSDVALERLQFAHRGFLSAAAAGKPSGLTGTSKAKLTPKGGGESVEFSFNPTSMSMVRGTTFRSEGTFLAISQNQLVDVETLSITLTHLRLEGAKQVEKVATLFSWLQATKNGSTTPATPATPGGRGTANQAKAQRLDFVMGGPQGIHYEVTLNRLDVTYTRFDKNGSPVRANLTITLADATVPPARQNPTSDGPPGRRVHTVTEGDNLPGIAQATYGNPNAWRRIAAANGIDDPLRMRNGRVLLLPGEQD